MMVKFEIEFEFKGAKELLKGEESFEMMVEMINEKIAKEGK